MDASLDTLATALYVKTDDLLKACPEWAPQRPAVGITPKLSDAELVTLAAAQRRPRCHLGPATPRHHKPESQTVPHFAEALPLSPP